MAAAAPVPQPAQDTLALSGNAGGQMSANANESNVEAANKDRPIVERFKSLEKRQQIQLIAGLSLALAVIVAVFMWTRQPEYKLLFGNLNEKSVAEIVPVLQKQNIPYKLDEQTGELMVPREQVHSVRIALAAQGLPKQDGAGFEVLDEKQNFGTSQFMESARYNHAMEGELARSIKGIAQVEMARVHLAIPKQSVFIRDRQEPSASVLVGLSQGKTLDENQVAAIVHLVSSSVPNLKPENVTVVDQTGKMLTKRHLSGDMAMSSAQFDFRKKLETDYIERIERILTPIVGFESVRAQVDADVDFSVTESSAESFNPDLPAVRSERTENEESRGGDLGGIPGALTNQPPGVATAPETLPNQANQKVEPPSKKSSRSTLNYELDRTVSHTRNSPGVLKRLSVAVVVDDKTSISEKGEAVRTAYAPEEIDRITNLVKDAVGFSIARGDTLNVINVPFQSAQPIPPAPSGPLWEQPWFIDMMKQGVGILAVLIIIWLVIRPVVKALTYKEPEPEPEEVVEGEGEGTQSLLPTRPGGLSMEDWKSLGVSQEEFEQMLQFVRDLVKNDPRLVAQVVKTWVTLEDESAGRASKSA